MIGPVTKLVVPVWLVILLVVLVTASSLDEVRYDNYRMYSVFPVTPEQSQQLQDMQTNSDSLIFLLQRKDFSKVIVAPHKASDFELLLEQSGTKFQLDSPNLQRSIDEERSRKLEFRTGEFNWNEYQELHEINDWMYQQQSLHPKVVSLRVFGKSYEKRDLLTMKISHRKGNKAIFIEAGIHAREWISPAVATYLINELLNSNSTDMQGLAKKYDWHFVVNTNPDGYVHTQKDRFWRKTRQPYRSCIGADPNRNFNSSWGLAGVSHNPCDDIYAGSSAHSEVEIQALTSYVSNIPQLRLYISFHSYSQLLMLPFGHSAAKPDNDVDLHNIAAYAVKALSKRYGTVYKYGNIQKVIYAASGGSTDWVIEHTRAELAFCYELRPSPGAGYRGFELPTDEIIPTAEETTDSIKALIERSVELGYFY